jgi:hypothetical protein
MVAQTSDTTTMVDKKNYIDLYTGAHQSIDRRELPGFELTGKYICESVVNGVWCAMHVGSAGVHRFESRTGMDCTNVEGLGSVDMGSLVDTILVGYLENSSRKLGTLGYRRIHIFDVLRFCGRDIRNNVLEERRKTLWREVWNIIPPSSKDRVLLVPATMAGFLKFYDQSVAHQSYGVMLKRMNSSGRSSRSDGSSHDWIHAKPWSIVHYVIKGFVHLDGDLLAGLALYDVEGKLKTAMKCPIPGLKLVGETLEQEGKVVEMCGKDMTASGSLKHASFLRWRDDVNATTCTGGKVDVAIKPT